MTKRTEVPIAEVELAEAELAGWCTSCQQFVNHGEVEPDAQDYTCEECEQRTVQGVGNALIGDLFQVVD